MEAVAAVGLASSVITFIDFGYKIVAGGVQAYKSAEGTSAEHNQIKQSLDRLDVLYAELSKPPPASSASGPTSSELELIRIAVECARTAEQLRTALQGLAAKPHSVTSTAIKSVKTLFDTNVKKYKERLDHLNKDFQRYLGAVLLDHQSNLSQFMTKVANDSQQLSLDGQQEVKDMHTDLVDLVKSSQTSAESHFSGLEDTCQAIQRLLIDGQQLDRQHRVLESLYFDGMRSRRHHISATHEGTFGWIFDDHHDEKVVGFPKWLRAGSGAYWINGKPGAGKSTLMKFLPQHEQTLESLRAWAGQRRLVTGSFYFWSSGNKMERSLEGLLRSMVFEILQQCLDLITCVLQNRERDLNWTNSHLPLRESHWSQKELMQILAAIASADNIPSRFCFFIDGMDEYEGEDFAVSKVLHEITSWPNFKLCLASRPHNTFQAYFGGENDLVLELHKHTRDDIRNYAADLLGLEPPIESESDFDEHSLHESVDSGDVPSKTVTAPDEEDFNQDTQKNGLVLKDSPHRITPTDACGSFSFTNEQKSELLDVITYKAEGVFLWVFLVVRRLQKSIYNGDSFEEVSKLIHSLPQDLIMYFNKMLDTIDGDYWQSSAEILLICISVDDLSLAMEAFQSINPFPQSLTFSSLKTWREETAKRIKARCSEFINIVRSKNVESGPDELVVEFAHRTMGDFFSERETFDKLQSRVDETFDPAFTAYKSLTNGLSEMARVQGWLPITLARHIWQAAISSRFCRGEKLFELLDEAHALIEAARDYVEYPLWCSIRSIPLISDNEYSRAYLEHISKHDPGFFNRPLYGTFLTWGRPLEFLTWGRPLEFLTWGRPLDFACECATHWNEAELIDVLLNHGARPNRESSGPSETMWSLIITDDLQSQFSRLGRTQKQGYSKAIEGMFQSMINAGAELDFSITYYDHKNKRTHHWTLDELVDNLILPEDATRIKRLIQQKREMHAREVISKRAQWSGWE